MTVSSTGQLRFFFLSVLAGLISGAFYNLLRAVREKTGRGPVGPLSDLFFWVFVGAALIKLSLDFNDGGIRGYQLLGAACGFLLHYLCLGGITLPLARAVVRAAALALFPVVFLMRGVVLYVKSLYDKMHIMLLKLRQSGKRVCAARKKHKKIQKKYKNLL